MVFARLDVSENIVFEKESDSLELTWHTLHSDIGPLLIGAWYRPPKRGDVASIQQFDRELEQFGIDHVGKLILGDMNVHNADWLAYSNGSSPEGRELEAVSAAHGLAQCVELPSRGEYLLDLVLSDFPQHIECDVVPGVLEHDHRAVIASVDITIPCSSPVSRECFDFAKANWKALHATFKDVDWSCFFQDLNADDAASNLTAYILSISKRYIPLKVIVDKPYKHPWIDDRCRQLLKDKHDAIGSPDFPQARDACTSGFATAYAKFIADTRTKLRNAEPKDWWKTSKQLLSQTAGTENIPPLKSSRGWAKRPQEKADLLSATFVAKSQLPEAVVNEFSPVLPSGVSLDGFLRLRVRDVRKILRDLDEASGTGPDFLPSLILRRCAHELALPVTLLSRLCLNEGRWPACWRLHWVHPLHKRKAKSDAKNYRGIHLTPQLAKVVERAVGSVFLPWLSERSYGEPQYAYTSQRSHRDVLAVNVCSW